MKLLILTLMISLTACGIGKKLDTMGTKMDAMDKTMKDLNGSITETKNAAKDMDTQLTQMEQQTAEMAGYIKDLVTMLKKLIGGITSVLPGAGDKPTDLSGVSQKDLQDAVNAANGAVQKKQTLEKMGISPDIYQSLTDLVNQLKVQAPSAKDTPERQALINQIIQDIEILKQNP